MLAARVDEKDKVSLVEVPMPSPQDGEVLIAVTQCGICGSDLGALRNGWTDYAMGHEFVGRVHAVGQGVKTVTPGMRVTAECFEYCGKCPRCLRGQFNICDRFSYMGGHPHGALAEFVVAGASAVHPVDEALSDDAAALIEPLAVAARAVRRTGADPPDAVGIIGAGAIGLLCTAAAAAAGLRPIVLAKHPHQARAAAVLGAAKVVELGKEKPTDAMVCDGQALEAVIDTVAQGTSLNTAISVTANDGTVVLLGEVTRPALAMLASLVHGEKTITGSFCYGTHDGIHDFQRASDLLAGGHVPTESFITHRFPLDELQRAFDVAGDKSTEAIKVLVKTGR